MTDRARALLASAALLAAVWWPLVVQRDGFPLSTYPMFAKARPTEIDVDHVVGVGGDGTRTPVPPELVAHGEVLQTRAVVAAAVQRGRKAARELCRAVAARTGATYPALEVRSDRYHVLRYFDGERAPLSSRVHARCQAGREK